jgi:PASTA domain
MSRTARVRAARLLVLLGFALAASGWAAASSDAAVTLGSPLAIEPTSTAECGNEETGRGCLLVNDAIPSRELAAPFSGVIVRWHVRLGTATEAQAIRIRVLKRVAPEEFKIVGSSPLELVPKGAGTYAFPAALPIAAGDEVGIESDNEKTISLTATSAGASFLFFNVAGFDATETGPPFFPPISNSELTYNVEVEPDCDHDGLGDETQDPNTSSCHPPPSISTGLPEAPKTCVVPKLNGKILKAAKKRARKAHCRIGSVKLRAGVSKTTGKVVKQKPKAGKVKAAGSKIAVTLG